MISGISKIVVPVHDQARAKDFWTTRLGFDVVTDESYGDERWIEVSPPSGSPVLVLSPRAEAEPRRDVPDQLPHSPVFFTCDDLEADPPRARRARGALPGPTGPDAVRLVVALRGRRGNALRARAVGVVSERSGFGAVFSVSTEPGT